LDLNPNSSMIQIHGCNTIAVALSSHQSPDSKLFSNTPPTTTFILECFLSLVTYTFVNISPSMGKWPLATKV
jgi:hypothetical protein